MKAKYGICIVSLCLFSYMNLSLNGSKEIVSLYNGASFDGRPIEYALIFFLFSTFCLFIYHEFETHMFQSGMYFVIREQSRSKITMRLGKKLFIYMLQFEGLKLISYVIIMLIMNKTVVLKSPVDIMKIFLLHFLAYFIILMYQVLLEIMLSSKIALFITLSLYIVLIGISDFMFRGLSNAKALSLIILPNISMKLRLEAINLNDYYFYVLVGYLLLILFFTYIISRKIIAKLDIY